MDSSALIDLLFRLGPALAAVIAYEPVKKFFSKLVARWSSTNKAADSELATYRRRDVAELVALKAEVGRLQAEYDALQQRYYEQREIAAVAARDVEHFKRLAHQSVSMVDRAEIVARSAQNALPIRGADGGE